MKNSVADIKHCYGCGVCSISCSHNAIEMQLDKLGFYQPFVDKNKCTNCGLCRRSCAYLDDALVDSDQMPREWFAGWSNDEKTVASCSSGGVAYEFAKSAIESGYKVIGVRYNVENHRAEHVVCESVEELEQTKGSKYLPSYTVDAFQQIKKGNKWLVIGTPCQIDSLRRYVRGRNLEEEVIFVDFFCHGVPSYNVWYKNISQFFSGIKIKSIAFRTKQKFSTKEIWPWHASFVVTSQDVQDTYYQPSLEGHTNWFYYYFLNNLCLGQQCYSKCKYKMYSSSADIRIGDAWTSVYNDNEQGVSSILAYTNKGVDYIKRCSTIYKDTIDLDTLCEGQMQVMPKLPKFYKLRLGLMRIKRLRFGQIEKILNLFGFKK